MGTTSVRLPDEMVERLDEMAEADHVDRSTMIRRAIEAGLHDIAIDRAVESYQRGGTTAWEAARRHDVSLFELLEELRRRDLWFRTDEETLREQLEGLS